MDYNHVSSIIFTIFVLCYLLIIYIVLNYDKTKHENQTHELNKYITEHFKDSYCAKLITGGGGSFKFVDDKWLVYYNSGGNERTRTLCFKNKNKSYFHFILKDSLDNIEKSIKMDWSSM